MLLSVYDDITEIDDTTAQLVTQLLIKTQRLQLSAQALATRDKNPEHY